MKKLLAIFLIALVLTGCTAIAEFPDATATGSDLIRKIVDRTKLEDLDTDDALEYFYSDGIKDYLLPSIKSHYVYVEFANGTTKNIKDALVDGDVTIDDLRAAGIFFYEEYLEQLPSPDIDPTADVDPSPTKPAKDVLLIVDLTETGFLATADALEGFWEDDEYTYTFESIKSHYVRVVYTDLTWKGIKDALADGDVTIDDLTYYGIEFWMTENR